MKPSFFQTTLFVFLSFALNNQTILSADFGPVRALQVPEGFEVVKVAGPGLVDRPVVATLDDQGRLYVLDSCGSTENPKVQLEKKPNRIIRLEDTNNDGIYDKSTVYADKLGFCQGVMWLNGSLYVTQPPVILKLTDKDNDGKSDQRDVWFDGKSLTFCANDLHGPYAGPDGFIYWTKGAFDEQTYTLPTGRKWKSKVATILRAKPDGSQLEPVMTGGMDNPVDVVFLPNGERIFSTTFFQHPSNGARDGLVHAVYGAMYGKDHEPVYQLPWTSSQLMPPMTHMGPAAPSGLHCYESDHLGSDYTGNLFCAQFNLRTVSRHILQPIGSTYKTIDAPFVWSDDFDFHPTDVIEDQDGSLLVLDTGSWYKICCPSSQLAKAEELGGIYRVKKKGTKLDKAANEKAKQSRKQSLPALYTAALYRDKNSIDLAIASLNAADYHTRRLAAEACGRIADSKAVPHLLKALADQQNDHVLNHSLTYALLEIGNVEETQKGLASDNLTVKLACMFALNTFGRESLKPDQFKLLIDGSGKIKLTSSQQQDVWYLLKRNVKCADGLVGYFKTVLTQNKNDDAILQNIAGLCENQSIQTLIGDVLLNETSSKIELANALKLIQRSQLKQSPPRWIAGLSGLITRERKNSTFELLQQIPALVKNLPPCKNNEENIHYYDEVKSLVNDATLPSEINLSFVQLLPDQSYTPSEKTFQTVLKHLTERKPETEQLTQLSNHAVNRLKITEPQIQLLAEAVKKLPSTEVIKLLPIFEKNKSEAVGASLLLLFNQPQVKNDLRAEQVKSSLEKFPQSVKSSAAALIKELEDKSANENANLQQLISELPKGDMIRGQAVFNSKKTNCKACHMIGYVGGNIGPDLTTIGKIRTERDLIESIVYPSASFVRSYEPVKIELKDGRTFNGVVKSDRDQELVLTIAADQEMRIKKEDIEAMSQSKISVMPSGLDQQMTKQELADLIAFLKQSKPF